jgi:hypothetical protein
MLRKITCLFALILASVGVATAQSRAHIAYPAGRSRVTLGLTYSAQRAKTTNNNCNCFWLQGGAADINWKAWRNLGITAEINGGHASNIGPGVDLSKIDLLLGPRFTWQPSAWKLGKRRLSIFGEFLAGGTHAFNTVVPTNSGVTNSATSFALQTGVGSNLWLTPHLGWRVMEMDYGYSQLPNAGSGTQSEFRIATGIVWKIR